jgi:hypothetical protein
MSEGLGAASPSPAPSNGASGTTAPAPGTTSAPVTPKNGEGAVAKPPAAGETKPSWQPLKTKLKFGDGAEEDVEISDEETLQRRLIAAKGFDRANKEALALKKEKEQRAALIQRANEGDPQALKALGLNPDAFFQKRLEEEARRAQMSEEQRAIHDAKAEAARAKAEADAYRRQVQQHMEQQAEQQAWGELEPRLKKGMEAEGMIGDTFAMDQIASVAQEFIDAGLDVPPEVVIKEAAARDKAKFDQRLTGLTPEHAPKMWAKFSPEVRKTFGFLAAQDIIKARSNIPAPEAPAPAQVTQEKSEPVGFITPGAYLKRLSRG